MALEEDAVTLQVRAAAGQPVSFRVGIKPRPLSVTQLGSGQVGIRERAAPSLVCQANLLTWQIMAR